jgi:hypothetical protein
LGQIVLLKNPKQLYLFLSLTGCMARSQDEERPEERGEAVMLQSADRAKSIDPDAGIGAD